MSYFEKKRPVVDPEGSRGVGAWRSWGCPKQGDGGAEGFCQGSCSFCEGPVCIICPFLHTEVKKRQLWSSPILGDSPTIVEATEGLAGPQQPSQPTPGAGAQLRGRASPSAPAAETLGEPA